MVEELKKLEVIQNNSPWAQEIPQYPSPLSFQAQLADPETSNSQHVTENPEPLRVWRPLTPQVNIPTNPEVHRDLSLLEDPEKAQNRADAV